MQRWKACRSAAIELPFKLLVSVIISAVTVSAGFGALSQYSRGAVELNLREQAQTFASTAVRLDTMGLDSSLTITLKLEGVATTGVDYFRIGYPLTAPLHPYCAMVRYRALGSDEGHVYLRDTGGNPLPVCSAGGGTLSLGTGTHELQLVLKYSDVLETAYILVEEDR